MVPSSLTLFSLLKKKKKVLFCLTFETLADLMVVARGNLHIPITGFLLFP